MLGDTPFRFLGANANVMHGPKERKNYEAVLDAVVGDQLKVVRIWALGEQVLPGEPHHPLYAFRIGEEGWVEESFVHLDRVLVAARARGLRVIVVLANRWKDYGGIATYLRWSGVQVARNGEGEPVPSTQAAFFDCARCQTLYREHILRVVGRTNSITQVPYSEDPTIMAWELINEASAVSARDEDSLLAWVKGTANYIRSLDSNHLISAGHIGYRTRRERKVWRAVQSLPEIDFADTHVYPESDPRIVHTAHLTRSMDDPIALAQLVVNKPLVFGEFGFKRKLGRKAYAQRVAWMQAFVQHLAVRGVSGALVWIYEPADNPRRTHTISPHPRDLPSLYVRGVLSQAAYAFSSGRPARLPKSWTRTENLPHFAPKQVERSTRLSHRRDTLHSDPLVIEIDPQLYSYAMFERSGVYREHVLDTVWGAGEGFFEYRFIASRMQPRALRIEARISSELPGFGDGQDPRDGSDIEISLDGEVLGTARAKPDDGVGDLVSLTLDDPAVLRRIFSRARRHTLRFEAKPSEYAGGLCIYGKETGLQPVPDAMKRELRSIRVTLFPAERSVAQN